MEINAHANAVNVAGAVTVDEQNVTVAGAAEVVDLSNKSEKVNNLTNNYNFASTAAGALTQTWPTSNLPASYIFNSVDLQSNGVAWSNQDSKFTSIEHDRRQKDEIFKRWHKAREIVENLEQSQLDFGAVNKSRASQKPTLEQAKFDLRINLKTVNKRYRRGLKAASLSSLTGLYYAAILNEEEPPDLVVEVVASTISLFDTESDYMRLNSNAQLAMRETIEIFETVVKLFSRAMEYGRPKSRLRDRIYNSMKSDVAIVKGHLKSASLVAKNRHKVDQHSDTNYLPWQNMLNEWICNTALRFYASNPRYTQDYHGGLSFPRSSPNNQGTAEAEGPSITALRRYLSAPNVKRLSEDIEQCSSPTIVSSNSVIQRLSALTRQEKVQDWLRETSQASAMLVHGKFWRTHLISPLSYLCAQISKEYTGTPGFLVLSYFCSLHTDGKGSNPAIMLSCLIEQLLSCASVQPYYHSASIDKHLLKGLKKKDVNALCKLFKLLIEQILPSNMVVFCLIDSISYYEVEVHRDDIRVILAMMKSLVRSQRGRRRGLQDRMVFKLMVTDGASSLYAYKYFEHGQTVEMIDAGNGSKLLELGAKR